MCYVHCEEITLMSTNIFLPNLIFYVRTFLFHMSNIASLDGIGDVEAKRIGMISFFSVCYLQFREFRIILDDFLF